MSSQAVDFRLLVMVPVECDEPKPFMDKLRKGLTSTWNHTHVVWLRELEPIDDRHIEACLEDSEDADTFNNAAEIAQQIFRTTDGRFVATRRLLAGYPNTIEPPETK